MSASYWLNSAWMLKCAGERAAFRGATRRVEFEQAEVLRHILSANRGADFGRRHNFESIGSPRHFQELVPVSAYDDCSEPIARIAAGQTRVLTRERVRLFEPTSGSTGAEKLIPYTNGLQRQFQRGLSAWVGDLLMKRPAIRSGRAYWSISPALGRSRRTAGGIPIGFDDDAAYLGRFEQWALRRLLVAPTSLARIETIENFRYCTLLYLLAADDLTLISIWNPTFLTSLLTALPQWSEQLCRDISRGAVTLPTAPFGEPPLGLMLRPNRRRADKLAAIFRTGGEPFDQLAHIWPRLTLMSCWADAAAAGPLGELSKLFPDAEIQPKGLLATEGIVSIPQTDCAAPALAIRSHFFEFIESESESGSQPSRPPFLAHKLEAGGKYKVILTTAGGLYRYRLGDEVEVTGFAGQCPLLRFLGRGDQVSDLVGEKLAETHVGAVLNRALAGLGQTAQFALLAPADDQPARYRLYLQMMRSNEMQTPVDAIQRAVESGLCENPHYRWAVGLKQLSPVEICLLDPMGQSAAQIYEHCCLARGQKIGNIKPVALMTCPGLQAEFRKYEYADARGA